MRPFAMLSPSRRAKVIDLVEQLATDPAPVPGSVSGISRRDERRNHWCQRTRPPVIRSHGCKRRLPVGCIAASAFTLPVAHDTTIRPLKIFEEELLPH